MKQFYILVIVVLNLSFTLRNDLSFEGIVTFKLEYTNVDERLSDDYICSSNGDSMVYSHSLNGYVQDFYCDKKKIQTRWFAGEENMLSMFNEDADTLYYYNPSKTDFNFVIEKSDIIEEIVGFDCRKYTVTLSPKKDINLPSFKYDFYITEEIKIDPELYKDFNDGGYSQLMKEAPGLILKQAYYGPFYTKTRTATKVDRNPVKFKKYQPSKPVIRKEL